MRSDLLCPLRQRAGAGLDEPRATAERGTGAGVVVVARRRMGERARMKMSFVTRDVALAVIREIREPLVRIERRDRALADQARRAATSILLDIEEGNQRKGRDRQHLFRVAKGSAAELRAALAIGVTWGYFGEPRETLALLDRLERLLYGLVRPQSSASSRSRSESTDCVKPRST